MSVKSLQLRFFTWNILDVRVQLSDIIKNTGKIAPRHRKQIISDDMKIFDDPYTYILLHEIIDNNYTRNQIREFLYKQHTHIGRILSNLLTIGSPDINTELLNAVQASKMRYELIADIILASDYQIIFLQEASPQFFMIFDEKNDNRYDAYGSGLVSTLIHTDFNNQLGLKECVTTVTQSGYEMSRHLLHCEFIYNMQKYIMINVHIPPQKRGSIRNQNLDYIQYVIDTHPDDNFIIAGDFNSNIFTLHPFETSIHDYLNFTNISTYPERIFTSNKQGINNLFDHIYTNTNMHALSKKKNKRFSVIYSIGPDYKFIKSMYTNYGTMPLDEWPSDHAIVAGIIH